MRLSVFLLALATGLAGIDLVGCGGGPTSGPLRDGSPSDGQGNVTSDAPCGGFVGNAVDDGSVDDGGLAEAGAPSGADDAAEDGGGSAQASLGPPFVDDGNEGGFVDPTLDSAGGFDGLADATVGTLWITADASLNATTAGPCAAVDSLAATPSETAVGYAMTLTASGVDPSGQRSDVTLTWYAAAMAGSLGTTSGAWTTFTCAVAGTATVTVTASISGSGTSCAGIGSRSVALTCDAP
jgi:hypothetical protein